MAPIEIDFVLPNIVRVPPDFWFVARQRPDDFSLLYDYAWQIHYNRVTHEAIGSPGGALVELLEAADFLLLSREWVRRHQDAPRFPAPLLQFHVMLESMREFADPRAEYPFLADISLSAAHVPSFKWSDDWPVIMPAPTRPPVPDAPEDYYVHLRQVSHLDILYEIARHSFNAVDSNLSAARLFRYLNSTAVQILLDNQVFMDEFIERDDFPDRAVVLYRGLQRAVTQHDPDRTRADHHRLGTGRLAGLEIFVVPLQGFGLPPAPPFPPPVAPVRGSSTNPPRPISLPRPTPPRRPTPISLPPSPSPAPAFEPGTGDVEMPEPGPPSTGSTPRLEPAVAKRASPPVPIPKPLPPVTRTESPELDVPRPSTSKGKQRAISISSSDSDPEEEVAAPIAEADNKGKKRAKSSVIKQTQFDPSTGSDRPPRPKRKPQAKSTNLDGLDWNSDCDAAADPKFRQGKFHGGAAGDGPRPRSSKSRTIPNKEDVRFLSYLLDSYEREDTRKDTHQFFRIREEDVRELTSIPLPSAGPPCIVCMDTGNPCHVKGDRDVCANCARAKGKLHCNLAKTLRANDEFYNQMVVYTDTSSVHLERATEDLVHSARAVRRALDASASLLAEHHFQVLQYLVNILNARRESASREEFEARFNPRSSMERVLRICLVQQLRAGQSVSRETAVWTEFHASWLFAELPDNDSAYDVYAAMDQVNDPADSFILIPPNGFDEIPARWVPLSEFRNKHMPEHKHEALLKRTRDPGLLQLAPEDLEPKEVEYPDKDRDASDNEDAEGSDDHADDEPEVPAPPKPKAASASKRSTRPKPVKETPVAESSKMGASGSSSRKRPATTAEPAASSTSARRPSKKSKKTG